jgi:hypothetical protein
VVGAVAREPRQGIHDNRIGGVLVLSAVRKHLAKHRPLDAPSALTALDEHPVDGVSLTLTVLAAVLLLRGQTEIGDLLLAGDATVDDGAHR